MSHDLYASWATQEVTRMLRTTPSSLFAVGQHPNLNIYANRESGRVWPIPDGRITAEEQNKIFEVAVELKRANEGLHGVLTAIGQSQAYIHKGYSGSAIIIPNAYDSFPNPGNYIKDVLNNLHPDLPIGVFSYAQPDLSIATPFLNKITFHRNINLTAARNIVAGNFLKSEKSKTQWAHLREGSSDADAFFRYLQIAKQLDLNNPVEPTINMPAGLIAAVARISGKKPLNYLSNASGSDFHDIVWRNFWFKYVLTHQVAQVWTSNPQGVYAVNNADSNLKMDATYYKKFFSGRSDSPKNKIVEKLNAGTATEDEGWDEFAQNIHNRAHSYREDLDSGLSHIGMLTSDGKPSDIGYKFVDATERTGDCHSGKPWLILGAAILQNGNLGSFLHYIYKVSEALFNNDPLRFTKPLSGRRSQTKTKFDTDAYLNFLRDELANNLNVMNIAMVRGGAPRKAFQGEFAILRKFDFIQGFRTGVGLEINWPVIQEFLDFEV
jgi:hypothetical protein